MTLSNRDKAGLSRDSLTMSHRHIASGYRDGPGHIPLGMSRCPALRCTGFVFIHDAMMTTVTADRERVLPRWRPSGGARSPGISICEEK
jgi:hypothetical protein